MAQLDSYKGLYFATFDPDAPPLLDYLGGMTWYLDTFFDRREGGTEVVGGMHKLVIPCNWKVPAENFAGDSYHVPWTHLSALRTGFSQSATVRPSGLGHQVSLPNGHFILAQGPKDVVDPPLAELLAYEEEIRPEVERRLDPRINLTTPIVGMPCTLQVVFNSKWILSKSGVPRRANTPFFKTLRQ